MKKFLFVISLICGFNGFSQVSILINDKTVTAGQVVDWNTINSVSVKYGSSTKAPPKSTYGNLIYRIKILKPGTEEYYYKFTNSTYGYEIVSSTFKEQMNKILTVRYKAEDENSFLRESYDYKMAYCLGLMKKSYTSESVELEAQIVFQEKLGYENFSDDIVLAKSPRLKIQLYKPDGRIRFGDLPFSLEETTLVKELGSFPVFGFDYDQLKEEESGYRENNTVVETNRVRIGTNSGGEWFMGQFSYPGTDAIAIKDSMIFQITNYLGYKSNESNGKKFKGTYTAYNPFNYHWYTYINPKYTGRGVPQMDLKNGAYDPNYTLVNYEKHGDYHCLFLSYDTYRKVDFTSVYDGGMSIMFIISDKNPGTVYFIRRNTNEFNPKQNHTEILAKWKTVLSTIQ